jgi:hypothetical protein
MSIPRTPETLLLESFPVTGRSPARTPTRRRRSTPTLVTPSRIVQTVGCVLANPAKRCTTRTRTNPDPAAEERLR